MATEPSSISLTDAIAIYAAVVATFVLGWDIVKFWRTGKPKINVTTAANIIIVGGAGPIVIGGLPKHFKITITNRGDVGTTLTNLTLVAYPTRFHRLRKRSSLFNAVANPNTTQPMPIVLGPNHTWTGLIRQESELVAHAKNSAFYFEVWCSHTDKPTVVRVRLPK
jgi:hypothetical protein